ncbi:hypothetical protein BFJ69_g7876 [Fusarium oxysporum]|uniref:Aldehyde dehydrogenase domain-containing protein n=1 Tax=Fusarium oxysporum TaxID=5507 RepID=A0A420N4T8_FUSOX|nr:hypothetical protein BFJ69_g7876 [Fusarium oxysporum]
MGDRASVSAKQGSIPLLINGCPLSHEDKSRKHAIDEDFTFQGANVRDCDETLKRSAAAFKTWSQTSTLQRRKQLLQLAQLLRQQEQDVLDLIC